MLISGALALFCLRMARANGIYLFGALVGILAPCFFISTSAWLNPFERVAGRTVPKKMAMEF